MLRQNLTMINELAKIRTLLLALGVMIAAVATLASGSALASDEDGEQDPAVVAPDELRSMDRADTIASLQAADATATGSGQTREIDRADAIASLSSENATASGPGQVHEMDRADALATLRSTDGPADTDSSDGQPVRLARH